MLVGEQARVSVKGHRRGAVSELLLNDLHAGTRGDHEARRGVTQIMDPQKRRHEARNHGGRSERSPVPVCDAQGTSVSIGEREASSPRQVLAESHG